MNFDIDAIEKGTRTTVDVVVGNRDNGDPVGFKVIGPGSQEYEDAERAIQLLNVKEAASRRGALDMTSDEGAATVVDAGDKRRQMLIDKCVVGWFGFTIADKPAEFTPVNLARVLKSRPLWKAKLLAAIEDEQAFIKG
jgi:hypothetical protein